MGEYVQLKNYCVCQICGAVVLNNKQATKGWLVSPRRNGDGVIVIRCPAHISEWALRESRAGRTKKWRRIMAEGKRRGVQPIPPILSPFPMSDELPDIPKSWDAMLRQSTQGANMRPKRTAKGQGGNKKDVPGQ